jgi:predicted dehydrogenase
MFLSFIEKGGGSMKKIKVGIIGTGFSAGAHIEALKRIAVVEIVGVAGSSFEKAKETTEKYGIPKPFLNADELINDSEIEVVHNCTPNHIHFSINKMVLLKSKHLLSEKPLGMNSEESRELSELAKSVNVISGVCFNYRHYPLVIQMKEMIERNELGNIHLVYGGYLQDWLLYNTDYNWRLNPEQNGKSRAIADIGSHWCDTVQFVTGKKIVEVFADLKTVHPIRKKSLSSTDVEEQVEVQTEDYGSVLVHFEGGTTGVFTVSQVSSGRKNKMFFEIASEKGSVSWDQEQANKLWIGNRDKPNQELLKDPALLYPTASEYAHYPGGHNEGWPDGLKNLFLDFYSSIQSESKRKQSNFASLEDGHRIMKIVDAILESHEKKCWVSIVNE